MLGNGTSNDARKNAMGVTTDGVLYVHDIRCMYGDSLQPPTNSVRHSVMTGYTYVYNSGVSGHSNTSLPIDNHEMVTLILQTAPASKFTITCYLLAEADGTTDAYAVHNINILNLTGSTVTIYVSTVNVSGTRAEKSVALLASTKKSVVAIGNNLYDLNIPNAVWNQE